MDTTIKEGDMLQPITHKKSKPYTIAFTFPLTHSLARVTSYQHNKTHSSAKMYFNIFNLIIMNLSK